MNIDNVRMLRFVRAITRDHTLTHAQKVIGSTLALEVDRSTGATSLIPRVIAGIVNADLKTITTAIAALEAAGWLTTSGPNVFVPTWSRA